MPTSDLQLLCCTHDGVATTDESCEGFNSFLDGAGLGNQQRLFNSAEPLEPSRNMISTGLLAYCIGPAGTTNADSESVAQSKQPWFSGVGGLRTDF